MPVVTERLIVRTTPEQRLRLERLVNSSRLGKVSDHIRLALDEYIERHEADMPVNSDLTQTLARA